MERRSALTWMTNVCRGVAIRASMEGILQYGVELTNIIKQTPGGTLSSATPWLFEPPYAFLPLPMRQAVPDEKVDEIVSRRRDKEQVGRGLI